MSEGQLYKANEYQSLVFAYRSGVTVRIQDIGQAIDSVQKDRQSIPQLQGNCPLMEQVLDAASL